MMINGNVLTDFTVMISALTPPSKPDANHKFVRDGAMQVTFQSIANFYYPAMDALENSIDGLCITREPTGKFSILYSREHFTLDQAVSRIEDELFPILAYKKPTSDVRAI